MDYAPEVQDFLDGGTGIEAAGLDRLAEHLAADKLGRTAEVRDSLRKAWMHGAIQKTRTGYTPARRRNSG